MSTKRTQRKDQARPSPKLSARDSFPCVVLKTCQHVVATEPLSFTRCTNLAGPVASQRKPQPRFSNLWPYPHPLTTEAIIQSVLSFLYIGSFFFLCRCVISIFIFLLSLFLSAINFLSWTYVKGRKCFSFNTWGMTFLKDKTSSWKQYWVRRASNNTSQMKTTWVHMLLGAYALISGRSSRQEGPSHQSYVSNVTCTLASTDHHECNTGFCLSTAAFLHAVLL